MKWYFALSEASIERPDHAWRDLIRTAVLSARRNTTLSPHMLYDGNENAFTREMRAMGVTLVHHRIGFYDKLAERGPGYLAIASGAFLRVELPEIEQEQTVVLYTDCDVMFRSDPSFEPLLAPFAAAPQTSMEDYQGDMNTGVMLMNLPRLRTDLSSFKDFIIGNLNQGWPGCDQENYRRYYAGSWSALPAIMNWKPYWGDNPDAVITHWHGPKPTLIRKLIEEPGLHTNPDWVRLYREAPDAYRSALEEWTALHGEVSNQRYRLFVDTTDRGRVIGWAHDPSHPDQIPQLDFRLDGKTIWQGACNLKRPDVIAAGHPHDRVGFDFALPTLTATNHLLTIHTLDGTRLRISNGHADLPGAILLPQPRDALHA